MTPNLGTIFLILLALPVGALVLLRLAIPGKFSWVQRFLMLLATALVRIKWGTRYNRRMPRPRDTGAVYVANHRSSIDPFFLQVQSDRPMHWMVAKEYCEHPKYRWFLKKQCESIPTNRAGIDTAATKAAIRFASQGGFVGMFPEGRINSTSDFMISCRPGAVLVALRAKVPIIPCYIEGSPYNGTVGGPIKMWARVRVYFGEPIDLAPYYDRQDDPQVVRELTLHCVREIARLAGREDFEPQLAGRRWLDDSDKVGLPELDQP